MLATRCRGTGGGGGSGSPWGGRGSALPLAPQPARAVKSLGLHHAWRKYLLLARARPSHHPFLGACLPGGPREAFPGVDRTACGWMESWRGKQGWGWGWGCSPVTWGGDALLPVDTASVLAASSRGESKAGFPLGKCLCLLLALSACSGDNLFSCSSPELIAAFEVCKHARL